MIKPNDWRGFDDEILASKKEIVGYDIVYPVHSDPGDVETGPRVETDWLSIFGTIFTGLYHHFCVDMGGEAIELPGVHSEIEAVRILGSLKHEHPDKDFCIAPITREEAEHFYYGSCMEQEIQV